MMEHECKDKERRRKVTRGWPEPDRTISFSLKRKFEAYTLSVGFCSLHRDWKVVPHEGSLVTEGSDSRSTFGNSWDHR